ncbi:MAG: class I mannose-6-phosphate isomerase [Flavobacteriaceae bacterium]|jgi:mannose-6-phosphate isomerase|nr:class I mannose-6-phosphate isomerase [Flavobacteriaceae bacterium]
MLYPFLFEPTYHYRIWGGNRLKDFNKNITEKNIGESWEISTVPDFVSVIVDGALKGKNLDELVSEYREKLVGTKVYERYGDKFPLLIKFIDAAKPLSVQVHPNDEYARKHHNSFGKTEMWYILDTDEEAEIIIGFEKDADKSLYSKSLATGTIETILRKIHPEKGDVFYIPAGRVHAIGKGITLAEIQQTSDITYRIYDYNRIDKDGKPRRLHIQQAMEVVDFSFIAEPRSLYDKNSKQTVLIDSPFFKTSRFVVKNEVKLENNRDSFKILIFTEGEGYVKTKTEKIAVKKGQSVLLPASLEDVIIEPKKVATFLEVHID